MATPHIAGLIAYLISVNGNSTPAAMSTSLKSLATKNALSSIRACRFYVFFVSQQLKFCLQRPARLTTLLTTVSKGVAGSRHTQPGIVSGE